MILSTENMSTHFYNVHDLAAETDNDTSKAEALIDSGASMV